MSKVKTKTLRKAGVIKKKDIRDARKYVLSFKRCNKLFAINNIAYHLGNLDTFYIYSINK